jgi:hypothetical protein
VFSHRELKSQHLVDLNRSKKRMALVISVQLLL